MIQVKELKMVSEKIKHIFNSVVDIVFGIILIFIIIGIAIGTVQLFVGIWELFKFKGITGHYINLITDVLTLYVLVELSRSLVEYFDSHRLRLTFIADAAIVFIINIILIPMDAKYFLYSLIKSTVSRNIFSVSPGKPTIIDILCLIPAS